MAFGLGRLRLSSTEFWALTPRELAAAAEGFGGVKALPLGREALNQMIERFPDRK